MIIHGLLIGVIYWDHLTSDFLTKQKIIRKFLERETATVFTKFLFKSACEEEKTTKCKETVLMKIKQASN